jgi:DNA-binding NarL/FixJ family response regulator
VLRDVGEKTMEVNVAICCQVHLYAEGICKLLEEDDEINVLGVSENNGSMEALIGMRPDIIVTDLINCKKVIELLPGSERKCVLLINDKEVHLDGSDLRLMIDEGLGGLLQSESDSEMLRKAIKKLNEGELWIDRQTLNEVFSSKKVTHKVQLTKKEKETLECIRKGLTNKEIADKLYICEQTVKSHCNHLFKKFGVKSRLKLAVSAPDQLSEKSLLH